MGLALGIAPDAILRGLANATTPGRRMKPVQLQAPGEFQKANALFARSD